MKIGLQIAIFVSIFAYGQEIFVVPVTSEETRVHMMPNHPVTSLDTHVDLADPSGHILGMIMQNNWALLSDYITPGDVCFRIDASQELGIVVEYHGPDGDLNLVAMRSVNPGLDGLLIYHMGVNPAWRNTLIFGADLDTTVGFELITGQTDSVPYAQLTNLIYEFLPFHINRGEGVCSVITQHTNILCGGYFEFTRMDGIRGSAAVLPAYARNNNVVNASPVLFLPHVAQDTGNFWTGYSMLNLGNGPAHVLLTAFSNGIAVAAETFEIPHAAQDIAVIGSTRLAGVSPADVEWILIESDEDLVGCELFGSPSEARSYLAGFELATPTGLSRKIVCPAVARDGSHWTGICVLNPNTVPCNAVIEVNSAMMDDPGTAPQENLLAELPVTIPAQGKWLTTLDNLLGPAMLNDTRGLTIRSDVLIMGFVLIGDHHRQQLGGYLGIPFQTSPKTETF